jgi:uncharacterized integral membrane protein
MAYYKFKDGTTSLKNVEHFQMTSNSKLWIGISITVLIFIIFVIFYLKNRNANKQNFGFRFY